MNTGDVEGQERKIKKLQERFQEMARNISERVPPFSIPKPVVETPFKALEGIKTPIGHGGELFFEALRAYVADVEAHLSEDQELVIVHHQSGRPIQVAHIGFRGPQIFVLQGFDSAGHQVHLFASVGSLQLELMVVPIEGPSDERPRIGFTRYDD